MISDEKPQRSVILLGAGGHALSVADAAAAAGLSIAGFLDDNPAAHLRLHAAPHLGPLESAGTSRSSAPFHLALGDLDLRRGLGQSIDARWLTVIHPRAWTSSGASIEPGSFIGAMAIVQGRASLGRHVIINSGAIVEHDCRIGSNSHIAPRAVLGGGVEVGSDVLIGIGAVIRPNVTIGARCTIGAGAVVVADVAPGQTVAGVPARPLPVPVRG